MLSDSLFLNKNYVALGIIIYSPNTVSSFLDPNTAEFWNLMRLFLSKSLLIFQVHQTHSQDQQTFLNISFQGPTNNLKHKKQITSLEMEFIKFFKICISVIFDTGVRHVRDCCAPTWFGLARDSKRRCWVRIYCHSVAFAVPALLGLE